MASLSFTDRFKNKLETIGKDGVIRIDVSKAISKEKVPENKTHKVYMKLVNANIQLRETMRVDVMNNKRSTPDMKCLSLSTIKNRQNLKPYIFSPLKQASARLAKKYEIDTDSTAMISTERKPNSNSTGKILPKLLPPIDRNSIYLRTTLQIASKINENIKGRKIT